MNRAFPVALSLVVTLTCVGIARAGKQAPNQQETDKKAMDFMNTDYQKSMNRNKPMPIGMARPGTKQGNVGTNAEKKEPELNTMMNEKMK